MPKFFIATVIATNASEAHSRVSARLPQGFLTTGVVRTKSERHLLFDVQVEMPSGVTKAERNNAWVVLTSYGISPSEDLGSRWQTVAGVGR